MSKTIRYYAMRYYRGVTFCDFRDAALLAAGALCLIDLFGVVGSILVWVLLSIFTIILLSDAVLFNRYSFTINPSALKIFANNCNAFLDESDRFFNYVKKRKFYLYPLFIVPAYAAAVGLFEQAELTWVCLAAYLSYSLLLYSKSRFTLMAWVGGGVLAIGFYLLSRALAGGADFELALYWALAFGFVGITITLTLPWMRVGSQVPAIQLNSILLPMVGCQAIKIRPCDRKLKWHQAIVSSVNKTSRSEYFGCLQGANVILLTVESFSKFQTQALSGVGAKLPFFESYLDKSSISHRHYAIAPNTYQTLFTLYKGNYPNISGMRPVSVLNDTDYRSIFLTPHRLALFETDKLIEACGFEDIFCLETFESEMNKASVQAWGSSDREIYQRALTAFDKKIDERPMFLGIINSQTHLPYHVYDKERFNCHSGPGVLPRYLNAMEEADDCLAYLFAELELRGLLENTLVIITGDHGESFGESNYKGHSNAITREQLEVPFLLYHPKLPKSEFDFSTHFDLFPTIYDLLGIETDALLAGQSLFAENREPGFLAYSRTYQGDLPTCFGYIHPQGKLLVDMIYNRFWSLSLDDDLKQVYTGKDREALLWALYQGLEARNLLGEPKVDC